LSPHGCETGRDSSAPLSIGMASALPCGPNHPTDPQGRPHTSPQSPCPRDPCHCAASYTEPRPSPVGAFIQGWLCQNTAPACQPVPMSPLLRSPHSSPASGSRAPGTETSPSRARQPPLLRRTPRAGVPPPGWGQVLGPCVRWSPRAQGQKGRQH